MNLHEFNKDMNLQLCLMYYMKCDCEPVSSFIKQ